MTSTKKISDNSLNLVSGGTKQQTADDSRFLNVLLYHRPYQCDRYGEYRVSSGDHDIEIETAWASVGVQVAFDSGTLVRDGCTNHYYVHGKEVTQEQARQYAMDVVGVHLTRAQWDW